MDEQSVNTAGKELLDATQEAVIGAADNVETILKSTTQELGGEHEVFYLSPEFWVGMAFVMVAVGLFIPLKKALFGFLGQHIAKETGRITDAENLKTEARKLLAAYEEKLEGIDDETAAVVKKSKREISALKKNLTAELDQRLDAQEKTAKQRIEGERVRAESELAEIVSRRSVGLLEKALTAHLDEPTRRKLIDQSIDLIDSL